MSATITTGDDSKISHTLLKDGTTFTIPETATITCRVITMDHDVLTSTAVQDSEATGADWGNSLVLVELPASITNEIAEKTQSWRNGEISAKLETQVEDAGNKLTWFQPIKVIKGTID